jgi:3-dehydrotetronate 4-kinase
MTDLLFGAIADDLTGGVELASMLVSRGVRTHLAIGAHAPLDPAAEAVVFALKSRLTPADEAVRDSLAALDRLLAANTRRVFFKYCATFDSTPAGNIGPVAEALLDRLGEDFTAFCPAFCEAGRTVYQGHLFAGDRLISESPKRFDPMTPMTDPDLVRVLAAQSEGKTGLIAHSAVRAGGEAIRSGIDGLKQQGVRLALVDAVSEEDLASIADGCADLRLMTGNSSVAAHFPPLWRRRGWLAADPALNRLPAVDGHSAVLAGSVADRTDEQLRNFEQYGPVLRIDMVAACQGRDVAAEAFAWAAARLRNGPVAIATTAAPEAVSALQRRFGSAEVARRAEEILSDLAGRLTDEAGVRRLLIAGGETAGAILRSLGITTLRVGPYEGPGISRVIARAEDPIALVLKSGKLGPVDMFARVLEDMKRPIERPPALESWPP